MDIFVPSTYDTTQQVSEWEERNYKPGAFDILGVRDGSPAQKAGMQRGDKIIEFDGQTFPTNMDLRIYVFTLPIGKKVPVVVKRGLAKVHLEMEVAPKRKYDSEFSL
jgi:serine protease Do